MIISSAGALYLATYTNWLITYWIMAALIGIGIFTVLITGEPDNVRAPTMHQAGFLAWLKENVAAPFADFMQREHWLAVLLFILLYKLADAFMGVMTNPFLLDIGFTKEDIATIVKLYGVIATIAGSLIGGSLVYRWGVVRTLWICGIGHALTNLMFVLQAQVGADPHVLALGITMENITGGMGASAFVAFISNLTNRRYTATQYALLSSFAAFGRTWLSTPAGLFAESLGWTWFFAFATLLAVPGLAVLAWLTSRVNFSPTSLPEAAT
jgi:PAT family beta-lactamase induction signal transducer AmpG